MRTPSDPNTNEPADASPLRKAIGLLIVLIPLLILAAGGATQRWSQGMALVLIGLCALFGPVRRSPGFPFQIAIGAFLLIAAIPLLPHRLLPFAEPAWRTALESYFGDLFPATFSLQPWLTAEALVLLIAGIAWFYWIAAAGFDPSTRTAMIQLSAWCGVVFAAACLIFFWRGYAPDFWRSDRGFGPFPSRNHTGNVLAICGVVTLICLVEMLRRRSIIAALAYAAAAAVVATALAINVSRGSALAVGAGVAFWAAACAIRTRSWKALSLGLAAGIVITVGFLFFSGGLSARFITIDGRSFWALLGFRGLIFEDTFDFASASPWIGAGLGNFTELFALYREASVAPVRVIHPESDWLWIWSETGWCGLLALLAAIAAVVAGMFRQARHSGWRLRMAGLAAAGAFAVHGLIDVPAHLLGSAMPALLLFAISLEWQKRAGWISAIALRLAALVLIAVGAVWIHSAASGALRPGAQGVAAVKAATARPANASPEAVESLTSQALQWAPLDWQLLFRRATARVQMGRHLAAVADFKRAQMLQPHRAELPENEALIWSGRIAPFAARARAKALQIDPEGAPQRFQRMLAAAAKNPPLRTELRQLARRDPRLLLEFLQRASPEEFQEELTQLRLNDAELRRFSPEQLSQILAVWHKHDATGELTQLIAGNPRWLQQGWKFVARTHAASGDFRAAYELAQRFVTAPELPPRSPGTAAELRRRSLLDPNDFASAYSLIAAEMEAGDLQTAMAATARITRAANSPRYFLFIEAELAAELGDWPRAWKALGGYAALR